VGEYAIYDCLVLCFRTFVLNDFEYTIFRIQIVHKFYSFYVVLVYNWPFLHF